MQARPAGRVPYAHHPARHVTPTTVATRVMPDSGAVHPAVVPTATAAVAPPVNGARHVKRQRMNGSLEEVDPHTSSESLHSGDAYAHLLGQRGPPSAWSSEVHASSTSHLPYPRTASHGADAAAAVTTELKPGAATATAGSTSALNEGSSWQVSDPSNYPDLASYPPPQPYVQGPATTTGYNTTWPPPPSDHVPPQQPPYGAPAVSAHYAVDASSASAAMPFFPTPHATTVVDANHDAGVAVPGYPPEFGNVDAAAGPFPFPPSAVVGPDHGSTGLVPKQPSSSFYFDDASMHLKIQSLPILDNLATQLIHTISKASYPKIQELMRRPGSEESQAYQTLKNLFDQTRKVYSRETPFIDAIAIQMFQPNQQEIIRKANIATFISSILGAHDVSFFHLNEFFMETFVPLGHRLLKWQGAVFLELKTQIYISALMNSDGSPEAMLDELFPPDLDAQILTRHPDAPSLSPSEQDFIDRSRQRKSYLLAEPSSSDAIKELPKKYVWNDFVREFASCISKNVDGIINIPNRTQNGNNAALAGKNATALSDPTSLILRTGSSLDASGANPNGASALTHTDGNASGPTSSTDASAPGRKPAPTPSTVRQPWTKPEEDALLAGLERVHGPHWSQILALYGRGGSVSEVLKDRNQVQLKDKARNLKLWYLKTGKDVPSSLQGVTGELRKRGGARARAALGLTDGEDGAAGGENRGGGGEGGGEQRGKKKGKK